MEGSKPPESSVTAPKTSDIVLEQYKLAVEMWDRTRARRALSNSFYATINAGFIAALYAKDTPMLYTSLIFAAGFLMSVLWFFNIILYKHLTDAKKSVIMEMETLLPSQPFSGESNRVGYGVLSFTRVERGVPIAFCLIYTIGLGLYLLHKS